MEKSAQKAVAETGLLFLLFLFIMPRVYMDFDMGFWRQWALCIHQNGLSRAYDCPTLNYFPVFVYGLYLFDSLQGSAENIANNINSIKILFLCFDFLPVLVLQIWGKKLLPYKVPHLYLLLNIAYLFNSMVWGQIDSIYTAFAFLAIITGFRNPIVSTAIYLLALNTKPQAIEFLPILLIVWYYAFRDWKTLLTAVATLAIIQFALLAPFFSSGGVDKLLHYATHAVGLYNKLSICAFNIWYLIQPNNPYFVDDATRFIFCSYRNFGLAMFGISLVFLLVPVTYHFYLLRKKNSATNEDSFQYIFLGTGLVCLFFFYFNSQMHERYAHPIILFLFFYGVVSRNYWLYVLASIPYLLSLDKCFPDYLPIVHYKIIFASKVIALWYTATVVYGTYLYIKLIKRTQWGGIGRSLQGRQ